MVARLSITPAGNILRRKGLVCTWSVVDDIPYVQILGINCHSASQPGIIFRCPTSKEYLAGDYRSFFGELSGNTWDIDVGCRLRDAR